MHLLARLYLANMNLGIASISDETQICSCICDETSLSYQATLIPITREQINQLTFLQYYFKEKARRPHTPPPTFLPSIRSVLSRQTRQHQISSATSIYLPTSPSQHPLRDQKATILPRGGGPAGLAPELITSRRNRHRAAQHTMSPSRQQHLRPRPYDIQSPEMGRPGPPPPATH
ncbi:hypothetical protein BDW02DRAFT_268719 [Decorospora gaudefroyi]|uniref:Uncharacterized protein n=1 Tax=Decorospora gaudefroyi TaxID=184978 RepID=A0A6A5KMZ4_9PLEO|nr:hypothetical protein BDW02DRAFT_268719 [Decorospora gaudefroyi]